MPGKCRCAVCTSKKLSPFPELPDSFLYFRSHTEIWQTRQDNVPDNSHLEGHS